MTDPVTGSAACVSCGHTDPHDVPPIQLCRSCPCDGPCEAPACMCPDPLREVHPGCPRHGHSPEVYFEPDTAANNSYPRGYDRCSECFGYGIVHGHMGEPTDCLSCRGSGIERKRNSKGRYTS